MKLNKRNFLAILFSGLLLSICVIAGVVADAQSSEIVDGKSFESIRIGKSTSDDVVAVYGADYKLVDHNKYSYEIIYKNLGLSFYYCQADPNREIFVVTFQSPAKVATKSGIVLGESSFADVYRIYDSDMTSFNETDGRGIGFYEDEDTDADEMEDARTAPQTSVIAENTETESTDGSFIVDSTEVEKSASVVEQEISTTRNEEAESADESADTTEESAEAETSDEADESYEQKDAVQESAADQSRKSKIVRRIELVEKSGLRQCSSKFPGN
jgi:hypothetical protein